MTGCGSQKDSQVRFDQGAYNQILERQKAGLAIEEDTLTKLPEMGGGEYERLGDLYVHQNNLALALVQYNKALEAAPRQVGVRYKVGLLLLKQGLPDKAYEQFEELLRSETQAALAYEGMGQAHFQMGNDRAAEREFRQALALDSKLWKSHNFLGILYDRQNRYREAIVEYQAGLALKPDDPALHNNLGLAYYLVGQYEDAIRSFQQASLRGAAQPKIHNNLALAYAKLKRYGDALEAFKKGADDAQAYNNLGTVYLGSDNPRKAVACFQKAIDLQPRYYAKANENLALAQQALAGSSSSLNGVEKEKGADSCP